MTAPAARATVERQLTELSRLRPRVDPADIVEIVESVMGTLHGDTTALNARLYAEIESLASYIKGVKAEIADIQAKDINRKYLPAASDELNAIVGATEAATNDIFEAVESIEALTAAMEPEVATQISAATTRVYEACGFQDITGQRIAKVVTALQNIETTVANLLAALGEEAGAGVPAAPCAPAEADEEKRLMNGPQLPQNAISQADVDALLASFD